jgi:hypothetical protein
LVPVRGRNLGRAHDHPYHCISPWFTLWIIWHRRPRPKPALRQ